MKSRVRALEKVAQTLLKEQRRRDAEARGVPEWWDAAQDRIWRDLEFDGVEVPVDADLTEVLEAVLETGWRLIYFWAGQKRYPPVHAFRWFKLLPIFL